MNRIEKYTSALLCSVVIAALSGCVERELTVKTIPDGAIVELNDEQVGVSPVTVPFNWYGTYRVRMEKEGYQTLVVNQELKRPFNDYFPIDLLRDIFTPDTIDSYEWTFDLSPYQQPDRDALIQRARQTQTDTAQLAEQKQAELDAKRK